MGTAHPLLAPWIEDLVAVDEAGADDSDILQILADDQSSVPPTVPQVPGLEAGISRQIRRANETGALLEVNRHVVAQAQRSTSVGTGRQQDTSPAGGMTCVYRIL
jgi:hypothetical protein